MSASTNPAAFHVGATWRTRGMMSGVRDDWETPDQLFYFLDREFCFTLDLCAGSRTASKCDRYLDQEDDPLGDMAWRGVCWMNPPYGRSVGKWIANIVTAGQLSRRHLDGFNGARTPFFVAAGGMAKRQCTREFKIRPIRRKIRELLGVGPRGRVTQAACSWIGISTDEADRQKPSGVAFIRNRWPLLEDGILMSRAKCATWLLTHYGIEAPKSACKQCPYQGPERLLHLKRSEPDSFAELCAYDAELRTPERVRRWKGNLYIHSSRQPLIQVDLESEAATRAAKREAKYFAATAQGALFSNECEGMCGV